MRIVEAILRDQSTVLSVSSLVQGQFGLCDVCLSLPTVVNHRGVERVLQLDLSPEEAEKLENSASVLKATIDRLDIQ
jgi:L-lactate dehydrogenase